MNPKSLGVQLLKSVTGTRTDCDVYIFHSSVCKRETDNMPAVWIKTFLTVVLDSLVLNKLSERMAIE